MALTQNINYLQPSGFKVLIDRRVGASFSFFAQNVSHPALTTNAAEISFRKFASVPQVPDTFDYSALAMDIIIDEDLASYKEIYNWMLRNVNKNPTGPESPEPSEVDLVVSILTSKNNSNKSITYKNAFPTEVGSINLIANSGGTETITFSVTFRYTEFVIT